jgi:16S rRNA (cytidine1402-2'-O)-methyltransferase
VPVSGGGRLVVVATPIGNLGDLSERAAAALREADVIACEDTRRTAVLARHVGAHGRLLSVHQHREGERAETVREHVAAGRSVALVSDAGAPAVSDPGARVVAAVLDAGLPVEVVPGPSAVTAALAAAGLPADRFVFLGFLPRKASERADLWDRVDALGWTAVALESPQRIASALAELADRDADRTVVVCRELSKLHEEIIRGSAAEVAAALPGAARGEVTLVVAPGRLAEEAAAGEALTDAIAAMLGAGLSPSAAADLAARLGIGRRNAAYRAALSSRAGSPPGGAPSEASREEM